MGRDNDLGFSPKWFLTFDLDQGHVGGVGYAQSDQRMRRGATYAHLCYLVNIWCIYADGGMVMRRATSACAEVLLMRTHVIWLIYGIYILMEVGLCAERPAHAQRRYLCALMFFG